MKKYLIMLGFILSGCVSTPIINQADIQNVNFEQLLSQKRGLSCQTLLFGILPVETEASVAQAAWNEGIRKVSYVEIEESGLPPLFLQKCIIVYGN